MAKYERLVSRLPLIYQPEPADETLLNSLLQSTGRVLDRASVQVNHMMMAHWFDIADQATWDEHHQTERRERGKGVVNVRNAKDQREINTYPYVQDLGRLCSLLGIPPWREPALLRETVEEYRQRVSDLLAAFQLGLTTLPALRRLIEAELPENMDASPAGQRWPFAIEEPVPLARVRQAITVPGAPPGMNAISPLWRWRTPDGAKAKGDALAIPLTYIKGAQSLAHAGPHIEADADATVQPMVECVRFDAQPMAVGLAYLGNLTASQTLRLTPTRRHWFVRDGACWVSLPEAPAAANIDGTADPATDPSANGPWMKLAGLPEGQVQALCEAADRTLWLIIDQDEASLLLRHDGATVTIVSKGLPDLPLKALMAWQDELLIGTDKGLFRVSLFPPEGKPFAAQADARAGKPIHQMSLWPDGRTAVASDAGLLLLGEIAAEPTQRLSGLAVYALCVQDDALWLGVAAGLLKGSVSADTWQLYDGTSTSEDVPDWRAVQPDELPTAIGGLPPVRHIAITPDYSVWVGCDEGLARYCARQQAQGQAYQTVLEAFPDVCSRVNQLMVDERGMLWVAAAEGLLRFDGRDLAQHALQADAAGEQLGGNWLPLGQADTLYPDDTSSEARGHWRYDRDLARWQRYQTRQRRFTGETLALRSTAGSGVKQVCRTDSVLAELGSFDTSTYAFTPASVVPHAQLKVRVKPAQERIVDGGWPALPKPREGDWWRYVQLEQGEITPPKERPWWSVEGRLFPPPEANIPWPGHFRGESFMKKGDFTSDAHSWQQKPLPGNEAALFIYPPSARVFMDWPSASAIGVRVRLFQRDGQAIDPAITDRLWSTLQRARPAGVPMALLVEGGLIKGVGA
jgi:hypothetical protein